MVIIKTISNNLVLERRSIQKNAVKCKSLSESPASFNYKNYLGFPENTQVAQDNVSPKEQKGY